MKVETLEADDVLEIKRVMQDRRISYGMLSEATLSMVSPATFHRVLNHGVSPRMHRNTALYIVVLPQVIRAVNVDLGFDDLNRKQKINRIARAFAL